MRGTIDRDSWDVPVDLFFYREPEELEKAEDVQATFHESAVEVPVIAESYDAAASNWDAAAAPVADGNWDAAAVSGWEAGAATTNWGH